MGANVGIRQLGTILILLFLTILSLAKANNKLNEIRALDFQPATYGVYEANINAAQRYETIAYGLLLVLGIYIFKVLFGFRKWHSSRGSS